ncbi:hypothetical protein MASR1M32_30530 [Rhodobacter sp.]
MARAPTNWLSIFGGSAWQWDGGREQYYLHNFLTSQPDLNFHNPDVQAALLDVARFWLRRGVDGFRLDTINFYFHDRYLRDNPPLPKALRNDSIAPGVNPYNHQLHLFDKNQPENLEFLRKFRAVLDPCGAAAVGEVGDAQRGLEIMAEYTSGGDRVQMCYPFETAATRAADGAGHRRRPLPGWRAAAPDAWPCWSYSNHDTVRHITRWGLSEEAAKTYLTLLVCLRGSLCLYQGEELGLPEAELALRRAAGPLRHSILARVQGPRRRPHADGLGHRQRGRRVLDDGEAWLPVTARASARVRSPRRRAGPTSLLAHYRAALAFRRAHPALRCRRDGGDRGDRAT